MQDHEGVNAVAGVYTLLSRVFISEIDAELLAQLSVEPAAAVLEQAAPGFGAYAGAFDAEAGEAAAEEYCALFVLPGGVAPRAAAWMEGELATVGAEMSRLSQAYLDQLGLEIQSGPWGRLPLDHISLLLHLGAVANALPGGAFVAADLILPWAARFGAALSERASSPLYVAAGVLLQSLEQLSQPAGPSPGKQEQGAA